MGSPVGIFVGAAVVGGSVGPLTGDGVGGCGDVVVGTEVHAPQCAGHNARMDALLQSRIPKSDAAPHDARSASFVSGQRGSVGCKVGACVGDVVGNAVGEAVGHASQCAGHANRTSARLQSRPPALKKAPHAGWSASFVNGHRRGVGCEVGAWLGNDVGNAVGEDGDTDGETLGNGVGETVGAFVGD